MFRKFALFAGMGLLMACTNANDLDKAPVPLGNFSLGHNVAVAPNLVKGPVSREADKDKFTAIMQEAVAERFGRYDGDKLYHFGISLEGYVLAQPGIPIVASPKSILIFNLTVWDDEKGEKLNKEVKQITVIESFGGHSLLGSGYTQTEEEQMRGLARNGAKQIQNYLRRQNFNEGWFKDKPGDKAAKAAGSADEAAKAADAGEAAAAAGAAETPGDAEAPGELLLAIPEEAPEEAPAE